jgi:nicotinate dehydrogenase subunit A
MSPTSKADVEHFEFHVNGQVRTHEGQPGDTLLTVLHEQGLTATKLGCGATHCGACAVWVDDRVSHACDLPIWSLQKSAVKAVSKVITLEGLVVAEPRVASTLTAAFTELQAAQCGYCLSGILMRAGAFLKNASVEKFVVTEAAIVEVLDSHLCRCGSHQRIINAVMLAASRL